MHPDDRDRALQELVNFKDGADSLMVEYRSIAKDGRVVQMETYVSIVRDSAGIPQAVYGVTLDVTARKQAESDLERQTDELRRSNEELQRFAYVASHDLQEPLRMVTSYLQLLEQRYKSQLDQDAQDFIGYAVDGSARMKSLINDLLMYSRVGSRARAFESFPAQRAADQAIRNLEMSINETGAKVTIGELPEIVGDELQFVQLFQNLVGNAIKFRSDKTPEIKISAEPKDKNWLFAVQDNGIGMESEYLGRIFVIFQRLHNREQYEGTGIGLAICKKIVERHGGNIWADSQVGQGTTFYFEIPIRSTRS
ncbi:MAG: ATP-binding protein [Anaerolineae bacterium]